MNSRQKIEFAFLAAILIGIILALAICSVAYAEYPSMATPQTEPATGTLVTRDKNAPPVNTDISAVIVTQCNQLIAVYITDKDSKLLRFDKKNNIPLSQLMDRAWAAQLVERVEVSCEGQGTRGYTTTQL
jgi:hypothetical protein